MPEVSKTLVNLLQLLAIAVGLLVARRAGAEPEALLQAACIALVIVMASAMTVRALQHASK